jgi:hypothetical protein
VIIRRRLTLPGRARMRTGRFGQQRSVARNDLMGTAEVSTVFCSRPTPRVSEASPAPARWLCRPHRARLRCRSRRAR